MLTPLRAYLTVTHNPVSAGSLFIIITVLFSTRCGAHFAGGNLELRERETESRAQGFWLRPRSLRHDNWLRSVSSPSNQQRA